MASLVRAMSWGALLSLLAVAGLAAQSIPIYTYVQPKERTVTHRGLGGPFLQPLVVMPLAGGDRSVWLPMNDSAHRSFTSSPQRGSRSAPGSEYVAEQQRAETLLKRLRGLLEPPGNLAVLPPPIRAADPPTPLPSDLPSIEYGRDPWDEVPRNLAP